MQNQPTPTLPRRRRWFVRICLLLLVAAIGYGGWRAYDFRNAMGEAKAAGIRWTYDNPFEVIQKDWRAAFRIAVWMERNGNLLIVGDARIASALDRNLIRRLRPESICVLNCSGTRILEEIKAVSSVRFLTVAGCPEMEDVNFSRDFPNLKVTVAYSPKVPGRFYRGP